MQQKVSAGKNVLTLGFNKVGILFKIYLGIIEDEIL